MKFRVGNGMGERVYDATLADMEQMLDELDVHDSEHGRASLGHDEDEYFALEWNVDGRFVWFTEAGCRHLKAVDARRAFELWQLFIRSGAAALEAFDWGEGNGWVETAEWRERSARATAQQDREYWNATGGPENPSRKCQHDGCLRGQLALSLYCRKHNFEERRGKPCPFED